MQSITSLQNKNDDCRCPWNVINISQSMYSYSLNNELATLYLTVAESLYCAKKGDTASQIGQVSCRMHMDDSADCAMVSGALVHTFRTRWAKNHSFLAYHKIVHWTFCSFKYHIICNKLVNILYFSYLPPPPLPPPTFLAWASPLLHTRMKKLTWNDKKWSLLLLVNSVNNFVINT